MLKARVRTLESEAKMAELLKLEEDHNMAETLRKLEKERIEERQRLEADAAIWRTELDNRNAVDASKDEQLMNRMKRLEGEVALQKTENQYCMQTLIAVSLLSPDYSCVLTMPAAQGQSSSATYQSIT